MVGSGVMAKPLCPPICGASVSLCWNTQMSNLRGVHCGTLGLTVSSKNLPLVWANAVDALGHFERIFMKSLWCLTLMVASGDFAVQIYR